MSADRIRLSVLADDLGTAVSGDRIRLSELARHLDVDFPGLFSKFCEVCPKVIDDNLTVPAGWLRVLMYARYEGKDN